MAAKEHYRGYPLPPTLTGFALRSVCFQIPDNDEYKRAFWDRVFQLAQPYNWQQDNYADQRNKIAAEYWEQLLYANLVNFIDNPDCGVPEPNTCQTYPPTAPFIEWFPNNPVYTPDLVGEGYNNPAWYFATLPSNIAYGSQYGDIITSLDRFPPGSLPEVLPASGLPRFRINVNGTGIVRVKLVNMFGGSLIQTTVDDDIGTLNFVDVSKDTIALPPETNGELEVEFELTTPGSHHIDFIVISWVNSAVPFLHHGGGLRQVELCGFDEMPIYSPPFRFTEACGLEFYDGENWQPVTGWSEFAPACFTGADGADGADGATLFIQDVAGQLQTSPDNATWSDVPNAHYLHINTDNDPLTGGLSIQPTPTDQVGLSVKWPVGFTLPLFELLNTDNSPLLQFLTNRRLRFYGTSGNITMDGAGNDLNFSRVGANYLSALTNGALMVVRVGGKESVVAHQNGRTTFGHIETRSATVDILSQNAAWPALTIRPAASQSADLLMAYSNTGLPAGIHSNGAGEFGANDTGTDTYPDGLTVFHHSTNVPAAQFGVGVRWQGKTTAVNKRDMALIRSMWIDPADATRKAEIVVSAYDTSERIVMRGSANGSTPEIGFLGAATSQRVDVGTVDCLGNAGAKQALEILVNFGLIQGTINLGDIPIPAEVPQFNRCQIAARAGKFIMDTYLQTASDAIELGGFFANEVDSTFTRVGGYLPDYLLLSAWAEDIASEFPGHDPAAHVGAVEAYLPTFIETLYCSLDESGCFNQVSRNVLISLNESVNVDVQYFQQYLTAFYAAGLASMVTTGMNYSCDLDVDCAAFDCLWQVEMDFTTNNWSGSVDLIDGQYAGVYKTDTPTDDLVVIQIPFAIVSGTITVYNIDSLPNDTMYCREIGGSVYEYFSKNAGERTFTLANEYPGGIEISIESSYTATIPHDTEIRSCYLYGTGTQPTP